jgi:peptide deformylase
MARLLQIAQLGHPVLRAQTSAVANVSDPRIQSLIEDMHATLSDGRGVGLAAPQVYEPLRVFIISSRPVPAYPHAPMIEPTVIINPEIIWCSEESVKGWEGCLSIPGLRGFTPRSIRIAARYTTIDGATEERELVDLAARVFQHEFDHLNGIVYLDRLDNTRDIITEKEYLRLMS